MCRILRESELTIVTVCKQIVWVKVDRTVYIYIHFVNFDILFGFEQPNVAILVLVKYYTEFGTKAFKQHLSSVKIVNHFIKLSHFFYYTLSS